MGSPISRFTLVGVSMYVDILSTALDEWVTSLSGPDLIEYAVVCQRELLAATQSGGGSAYSALAAEVAYDRALIALCAERGIDAHAASFAYPGVERRRIETLLALDGVDLDAPPPRRSATGTVPRPVPDHAEGVAREVSSTPDRGGQH
jgi:hypothetical protein